MPKRIQRRRTKGWRMPPGVISCTRPGRYGNPFKLDSMGVMLHALSMSLDAEDPYNLKLASIDLFRRWVTRGKFNELVASFIVWEHPDLPIPPSMSQIKRELGGRDLACWCGLQAPCHVDVYLEIANQ